MARKRTKRTRKKRAPKNWPELFIAALQETGVVAGACRKANIGKVAAYERRKADPEFARSWEEALESSTDDLLEEAKRRAFKGTLEPVFQGGKRVGSIRKYSDTLIIFLIKGQRPQYRDGRPPESGSEDKPRRIVIPGSDERP